MTASVDFERGALHLRLTIPDAPFVALTGPNGVGKSSVLRCLAGLEPSAVVDWSNGQPATIGYLPQRVSLYPAMSLRDNVASTLRFGGSNRSVAQQRADELLDVVDVRSLGDRRPHEVSGGQRQRVGLARALAAAPELVLLDEPFTAIDVGSRAAVRARLIEHIVSSGSRCVLATHDESDVDAAHAVRVPLA